MRRGDRGQQCCGARGRRGGRGRGTVKINYDWGVTRINERIIRVHPDYRFENGQWFNIPENTWLQLTHMRRDYQSQKLQHNNDGSGTNSQCRQQRQVQQTYSYYQLVPDTIIQLSPQPHGSMPPPPPPI